MAKRSKRKRPGSLTGTGAKVIETPDYRLDPSISRHDWLRAIGLILATFLAYQLVWHAGFIWDDDQNITDNAPLRTWHGLWQIWSAPGATQQYYPLTHSSFWLEYHLWQLDPLGYHLDNVLLHLGNSFLILIILRKLNVPGAWLAAALFALHPVMVDSVAWATERKNTISGLFYLSSILAALKFWKVGAAENQERAPQQWYFYGLALLLYLAALFSKTATVPLPLVILLLLWWKRPPLRLSDFYLLAPFFVIGLAMGLMTIWVEKNHVGTSGTDWAFSWPDRFIIIGKQLWFYLGKLLWPYPLIFVYPRWPIHASQPLMYLPSVAALGGMFFLWYKRKTPWRPVFVAMAYFILMLLPTTALFNQYYFRFSFVSDHFQYLGSIGPLALAAGIITFWLDSVSAPWVKTLACGTLLSTLGILTWFQTHTYTDIETLWRTTLAQNPSCWMAYNNWGGRLQERGNYPEAMEKFEQALSLKPDYAEAHYNVGNVLQKTGQLPQAMEQFQQALSFQPNYALAHVGMGIALQKAGRDTEAIDQFKKALSLNPDYADAHDGLGSVLGHEGRFAEAIDQFQQALRLDPDSALAHYNLGVALQKTNRDAEAVEQFQLAISLKPDYADAYTNLGSVLGQHGRFSEAIIQFQHALKIDPDNTDARNDLARAQALLKSAQVTK